MTAEAAAPTTAGALIEWGASRLSAAGLQSSETDAALLLQSLVGVPATRIRARPMTQLSADQAGLYAGWIERRSAGEPVAYIVGHQSFMGIELLVDPRVLIVRPVTRLLAEAALELARLRGTTGLKAADVGTGSGAIALALVVLEPRIEHIYATDISRDALNVAAVNGDRYGVNDRVEWLEGDLLEPVPEPVDLVVANLPYVPASLASRERTFEPPVAIFGGEGGLALLRRFADQAPTKLRAGGALVLEIGPGQRPGVSRALLEADPRLVIETVPGVDHVLIAELPE